jgi:FKBP-type peptidyl-prolyl cis-trans isomerase FklB
MDSVSRAHSATASAQVFVPAAAVAGAQRPLLDAGAIPVDEFSAAGRKPFRPRPCSSEIFMKNPLIIVAVSVALAPFALAADTQLKDQKDKVSYSIGIDIGTTLKRQLIDVNADLLSKGIKDGLSGEKPLLNDEEVKATMSVFQKDMMAKQAAAKKATGEKNAAEGTKFLAANKAKEGVKTTASGLQYKVLKEGSGPTPKAADTVKVNYRGTTIDGTEFDSSYKRGQPATFPVNRVIKGWTEALQLMKPGSKYQLVIPADLAYGERGAGSDIGPNAALIFEVELLEVNPTPSPAPKPLASVSPAAGGPKPAVSGTPRSAASASPQASASPSVSPSPKKP